jgi:DNA-binding response OmpR family regulator
MLFPAGGPAPGTATAPAPAAVAGVVAVTGVVKLGELVVDADGHLVTWRGQPLSLTRLERELLACLATPPVAVWTYQRLFDAVWGKAYLGDTSILHSAVKRLRGKLRAVGGGLGVETVRGVGYRLALAA